MTSRIINKLLKNRTGNMLLCVCFLFCLQILTVCSKPKIAFFPHNNDYISKMNNKWMDDVTTLYKITNSINFSTNESIDTNCLTSYNGNYSIQPPYENSKLNVLFNVLKNGSIQTKGVIDHITKHYKHEMFKSDGYSCASNRNTAKSLRDQKTEMYENCYSALDYRYDNHDLSKYNNFGGTHLRYFLTVSWVPDAKQTCLRITYIHKLKSTLDVSVDLLRVVNETDSLITIVNLEKSEEIRHLKIMNIDLMKDKNYKLTIVFKVKNNDYEHNYYNGTIFGLIQIAECSKNQDEDLQLVAESNLINEPQPFRVFGYGIERPANSTISTKLCLNGGLEIKNSKCFCPPGFKGEFCETGCGQNLYGSNCTKACSFLKNKHCSGLLICTNWGCTCPVGLTGSLCNEDCQPYKYGANCEQTCSSNCLEKMCNKYTGICSKGCSKGYIPPKCQEKYPYLIKPPTRISEKYESIQIQLNFQSNNIKGGNKNKKMKYYQLKYRPSNASNTFLKSEFKEIIENVGTVTETLSDLIPDTSYEVGVLILANDGHFNDQDIAYDTYKTSCKQPNTNVYNITLINEKTYTNITWNKIFTEKLECKVQQYVLKVTLYQSENEISYVQEIIPSSSNNYIIDYRYQYPGHSYRITVTPKTSKGFLQPMSATIVSPPMLDQDVKIKDIVPTIKNSSINVSWELESLNSHNTSVKRPVVIKYKLNRILSCSLEDIKESKWTEEIINETNYEIINTIPNSQYSLQVRIFDNEKNNIQQENMVYLYTQPTFPKTKPELIQIVVTNNSVHFELNDASENCKDLNGFFLNYYIELKDTKTGINQTKETKKTKIFFDNLNENTSYEMKVFIKTHFGYNPDNFLQLNFETKNLTPIKDLMVYKRNIKSHMVGIRWKYIIENTYLDVVLVKPNNEELMLDSITNAAKCNAWPEYYCHTFNNKNISKTASEHYTLKVRPITAIYPHDGVVSISFDGNDNELLPESPKNVKAIVVKPDTVTLQWDIPWVLNSGLTMFIITVEEILPSDNVDDVEPIEYNTKFTSETPTYNYTINLKPGSSYKFGVISQSKTSLRSVPTSINITTPTAATTPAANQETTPAAKT